MIALFQNMTLVDVFGDEEMPAMLGVSEGAFFTCKYCAYSRSIEQERALVEIKLHFWRQNFLFKIRERDHFEEYIRIKDDMDSIVSSETSSMVHLEDLKSDLMIQPRNISINGVQLSHYLNATYNENPFFEGGAYLPSGDVNPHDPND